MGELDEMIELADCFFAAATGELDWESVLARFADAFGSEAAVLECTDRRTGQPLLVRSARLNDENIDSYIEHYQFLSPRQALTHWRVPLSVAYDRMLISDEAMDRDPFHAEFLAPHGLRYFMSCHMDPNLDVSAAMALQRSACQGHVSDADVKRLAALRPLLKRAFRQYWILNRAGITGKSADIALAAHGLTPAERRLALAVGTGERVTAYAARQGISANTAYSHYARVKHKLDCRSQGELVLRISRLTHSDEQT